MNTGTTSVSSIENRLKRKILLICGITVFVFICAGVIILTTLGINNIAIGLIFILVFACFIMLLGVLTAYVYAKFAVSPLVDSFSELSKKIKNNERVIQPIGINELDDIVEQFNNLSVSLSVSVDIMMDVLKLTNTNIGVFREDRKNGMVFATELIFDVLGLPYEKGNLYIPIDEWYIRFNSLITISVVGMDNVFPIDAAELGHTTWYQIRKVGDDAKLCGVIIDITKEVLEKRYLEYERDIDELTKLLNRRGFVSRCDEIMKYKVNKIGLMIFVDLDNLKYVNDKYGHEVGNLYLQKTAAIFNRFSSYNALVARLSGDEFAIYVHGHKTKEAAMDIVSKCLDNEEMHLFNLPDGKNIRIRYSMGYAWYPQDTTKLQLLMKYADFAMYEVKHSNKGARKEFNIESYNENSYLREDYEALNELLESNNMDYYMQPIFDLVSGTIFGYEALMRPRSDALSSPQHLLQLAQYQSKLYQLEKMTFGNVMEIIKNNQAILCDKYVFFNSIPHIALHEDDVAELDEKYNDYYKYLVMEISKNEFTSNQRIKQKANDIKKRNGKVAIDNFVTVYNSEISLFAVKPDIIKIDMSLIRNIDSEPSKQKHVADIVRYFNNNNIKVFASGIETIEEFEVVASMGITYVQGYYISKPLNGLCDIDQEKKDELLKIAALNQMI